MVDETAARILATEPRSSMSPLERDASLCGQLFPMAQTRRASALFRQRRVTVAGPGCDQLEKSQTGTGLQFSPGPPR